MIGQKQIETQLTVKNASLAFCAQVAQKVKAPQCIPFYEVYTYDLVARYYGVTEKRVMNAYRSHRYLFENDCCTLTGKEIAKQAKDFQDFGVSHGRLCLFQNGVMTTVMYTINMVFNTRALLMFGLLLRNESDVAKKIAAEFEKLALRPSGQPYPYEYKPAKLWFLTMESPTQEIEKFECPFGFCPPAEKAQARVDQENKAQARTDQNDKVQAIVDQEDKAQGVVDKTGKTREILQKDRHGNVIYKWESVAEASKILGISTQSIYNCCRGVTKQVRKGRV